MGVPSEENFRSKFLEYIQIITGISTWKEENMTMWYW